MSKRRMVTEQAFQLAIKDIDSRMLQIVHQDYDFIILNTENVATAWSKAHGVDEEKPIKLTQSELGALVRRVADHYAARQFLVNDHGNAVEVIWGERKRPMQHGNDGKMV